MGDTREVRIRLSIDSDSKELIVTEKNVKKLGTAISGSAKEGEKLDTFFSKATKWTLGVVGITSAIGLLQAGMRGVVNAAEDWRLVEGKINLVSDSTTQLLANQKALFSLSQDTYQEYGNSATIFTRLANATKGLKLEQQSLLDVTSLVNKGLVISSATAAEQSSTITQLSQALTSGVLRGEEFNAIMENGSRIAIALADGLGVPLKKLRAMSMEGELTSERVIDALLSQKDVIDNEFSQMPVRIEQSFTTLDNSMVRFIGKADAAIGASSGIARSIRDISAAIDEVDLDDAANLATIDFIMATISRTIDMFNVLYETAENGSQIAISGIAELAYGTLGTIAEMLRRTTEGLNVIGLSSDETLEEAYRLEIELYSAAEKAQKDTIANRDEIIEALKKANVTIEERIALYAREREAAKRASEAAKKGASGSGESGGGGGYAAPEKLGEVFQGLNQRAKEYRESVEATGRVMDEVWLGSADKYEQKIYAIAERWTKLLENVDDPELLGDAAAAIEREMTDALRQSFDDADGDVKAKIYEWGDTFNSSISQAIVDAIISGDVRGAMESLTASMTSSMLQSAVGNIANGGLWSDDATLAATTEMQLGQSAGALGGSAAGGAGLISQLGGQGGAMFGQMYGPAGAFIGGIAGGMLGGMLDRTFGGIFGGGNSTVEKRLAQINRELERQTDTLNAQLSLYSSAGLGGSSMLGQYRLWDANYSAANQSYSTDRFWKPLGSADRQSVADALGVPLESLDRFKENIVESFTPLQILNALYEEGAIGQADYEKKLQQIVDMNAEYSASLLDLSGQIKTAKTELNNILTDLTGTDMLYADRLATARQEVEQLIGGELSEERYVEYLRDLVTGLDAFGMSVDELAQDLVSEIPEAQDRAIAALSALTGEYFASTEQALNYLESIKLVGAEYAAQSSLLESVKADQYKASLSFEDLAASIASGEPTSLTGAVRVATDTIGESIGALNGVASTARQAADMLRSGNADLQDTLYTDALDRAKRARALLDANPNDPRAAAALQDAVGDMSSSVGGYVDNASTDFESRFRRSAAANQFDAFADSASADIVLLEKIQSSTATSAYYAQQSSENELRMYDQLLGGIDTKLIADGDVIQGLKNDAFTLTLGEDSAAALDDIGNDMAGWDWNEQKLSDILNGENFTASWTEAIGNGFESQNFTFDWNEDGIPDALKSVNPDGSFTVHYDFDEDAQSDLTLAFDDSSVLTSIETAQLDMTQGIANIAGTMSRIEQLETSMLAVMKSVNSATEKSADYAVKTFERTAKEGA